MWSGGDKIINWDHNGSVFSDKSPNPMITFEQDNDIQAINPTYSPVLINMYQYKHLVERFRKDSP